jgi:hypothetical protein
VTILAENCKQSLEKLTALLSVKVVDNVEVLMNRLIWICSTLKKNVGLGKLAKCAVHESKHVLQELKASDSDLSNLPD